MMQAGLMGGEPPRRTIVWKDDRNAANHAEFLDFARRSTERQVERMLRMMPIFPDAPELIVPTGDLWVPEKRIAFANEYELVDEIRRFGGGGLEEHKEASRLDPQRPETPKCEKCKTKTCGPDVTAALVRAVKRTKAKFSEWENGTADDKQIAKGACEALFSLKGIKDGLPLGALSWDIKKFFDKRWLARYYEFDCAGGECYEAVQVNDQCHYAGSVNYVIYGVMCRLCGKSQNDMVEYIRRYKGDTRLYWRPLGSPVGPPIPTPGGASKKVFHPPSGNYQPSIDWATAGYRDWPGVESPIGDRRQCLPSCVRGYPPIGAAGDWELRVRWSWIDKNDQVHEAVI